MIPFTSRYARNDKSELGAELDAGCVLQGYFPKITQILISGPATNATSCGIITIGSGRRLIRSKQDSSSHLHAERKTPGIHG